MRRYWVYILTNRSGTLYVGVTNDLERRMAEHREGTVSGFTSRYRIHRLLYCEEYGYIEDAIAREKQIKRWRREKKLALIASENPEWRDLDADRLIEDVYSARDASPPSPEVKLDPDSAPCREGPIGG
jgi:putative endonuclease